MPEHLLSAILEQEPFINTLQDTFYNYVEPQHLTGKLSDGRSGNYPRQCGIRVGTFRPAQFTPTTCLYGDRVFQRRRTGCSPSDTRLAATGRFLGMPFPKGSSRRRPARIPQSAHYPLRRSGAGRRSRRYAISR